MTILRSETMTNERAMDINGRLVLAYMVRERLGDNALPDLSDVSLTEAIEASRIAAEMGPKPDPDRPGWNIHHCHVEPTRVHHLWFWVMREACAREVEGETGEAMS
jgi:hypothetical protein